MIATCSSPAKRYTSSPPVYFKYICICTTTGDTVVSMNKYVISTFEWNPTLYSEMGFCNLRKKEHGDGFVMTLHYTLITETLNKACLSSHISD